MPTGPASGTTRARDGAGTARRTGKRRLGVMGGTFDPIHHGHLVAASEVAAQFHLDEVVFVPTGQPWQKTDRKVSPAEDRYLMTVIATAENPQFSVSRIDIDRGGPTYTTDTLRDLRALNPDADLFFITGADALGQILTWRDAEELFSLAHFIGVTRPGHTADRPRSARGRRLARRGPRAGHLVHGLPCESRQGRSRLVPGAGRCGALHRQARAVPRRVSREGHR